MSITDTDKAYIAGFLDGEGSIVISTLYGKNIGKAGQMKVVLSNTNREVLLFVQTHFGGGIYLTNQHKKCPGRKPCYQWIVASQKALSFLLEIEPYLKLKKIQAQTAIAFQNGRHHRHRHYPLSEEELAVAKAQRIVMAQLNKKGVEA